MAWHSKIALPFTALVSTLILVGCNVGKTDTVATDTSTTGTTATATTTATAKAIAGRYTGKVSAPDGNVWGDGTHPNDQAELAAHPNHRGLAYRLAGSFDITVADNGALSGGLTLYGYYAKIVIGQVPAGSNQVTFQVNGASGTLTFKDGRVTGRVSEPDPHKYGNISGGKI